ncbi:MAG TPA: hypothetical protein DCQ06_05085 [Myxococcales bacterium]|nr:hypothetical protein [Myxococcales bacterium]HAN30951.1 hypothetical protein [Myxococcales bacterium]|tara:strand:- start:317 stop:934 length:618 start_codon:yes stop_codon:yes gene_type:complete
MNYSLPAALIALSLTLGCSRTPEANTKPVESANAPVVAKAKAAQKEVPVVQRSEFVATGKPTPPCRDCDKSDGGSIPQFHGEPKMKLDEKTLADAKKTINATCDLLDAGVQILEANVDAPDKAAKALTAYQKQHKVKIKAIMHRADEIRGRLRAAGYDQDIPTELKPDFEARMSKIQGRLEKMRTTYAKHPSVLEAFGAFFPSRR